MAEAAQSQPTSQPTYESPESQAFQALENVQESAESYAANIQPVEQAAAALEPSDVEPVNDDDDIDWDGTVLSSAFTMKQPKLEYVLYNEQTGQEVIVDMGVLLGAKPSAEVPEGAKFVKLEDPTRTISRNHAAISFDQEAYCGSRITVRSTARTSFKAMRRSRVERKPMKLDAPLHGAYRRPVLHFRTALISFAPRYMLRRQSINEDDGATNILWYESLPMQAAFIRPY